ncbi:Uncharacterised protein [uncultured archaeon]|nr:Uncharacterised protein [uncultured archaeon]
MEIQKFNLEELAEFLVKAKKATYAGDGKEVPSQRPGFKELEYNEGDFSYRDSYAGFFMAPGQEYVRFKGEPIWLMSYTGGMNQELFGDVDFAKQTFAFLKKALSLVNMSSPFRGPAVFRSEKFEYSSSVKGDISSFKGRERIWHDSEAGEKSNGINLYDLDYIFEQDYIGGLVIPKTFIK